MKKIFGLIAIILITTCCFAKEKSLQGDFQIFKLGDGRKNVIQKIKDYTKEGKVGISSGEGNQVTLKKDNLRVSFKYHKNKLYMITILYPEGFKDLKDPREVVKYLKGLLTQTYSDPTDGKGLPEKTDPNQIYRCYSWVLKNKKIELVVPTDFQNIPSITVEIYNPKIRALLDTDLVNDFG